MPDLSRFPAVTRLQPVLRLAVVAALSWAVGLAAPAAASVNDFLAAHPRYEVLPAAYFEPELRAASFVEVALHARAFIRAGRAWHAEIDTGTVTRHPAIGSSRAQRWSSFLPVGAAAPARAEIRLYEDQGNSSTQVARLALPAIRATRFQSAYVTGPYTRQISRDWGEDGLALVLIQQRHRPDFSRLARPVLFIGGDFNYQRIENLVRYFRTHGVDALGYKPLYDREGNESLREMATHDLPDVQTWLRLTSGHTPPHLLGLCLGGIHARGLVYADELRAKGKPATFASVTTIGTPQHGSQPADLYNSQAWIPEAHRWMTGDAHVHRYKDGSRDIAAFNATVGRPRGIALRSVALDPGTEPPDPRYWYMPGPMNWLLEERARSTGIDARTDGLILVEEQSLGPAFTTWHADHAGMINDGRSGTYFDAYRAHKALLRALEETP